MALTPYTGVLQSVQYFDLDQADGTTTGGWIALQYDQVEKFSFHYEWTGTYAATIAIEVSNDPRCFEGHHDSANAASDDITSAINAITAITDPAGSAGDSNINVDDITFGWVRMGLSSISGTGTFKCWTRGGS